MATTDRPAPSAVRSRVVLAGLAVLAVAGVVIAVLAMRAPAQMGADEEVFHTVDALFTAVTARDERQLDACEQRLHAYRDAGRLPAAAAADLDAVIRKARAGRWESAAGQLYDFMKEQRRDGTADPKPKKKDRPGKAK